jgi:hypothetical protein
VAIEEDVDQADGQADGYPRERGEEEALRH